jgi:hypothetical protein
VPGVFLLIYFAHAPARKREAFARDWPVFFPGIEPINGRLALIELVAKNEDAISQHRVSLHRFGINMGTRLPDGSSCVQVEPSGADALRLEKMHSRRYPEREEGRIVLCSTTQSVLVPRSNA